MARELISYRHLLFMLAWRDIKIRYKQTIMGFLWALLMPMVIVLAGLFVKKAFSVASGRPLDAAGMASVLVKSVPWVFFVGSIRMAANSLIANSNLVTKIYFPREVFPLSSVLSNLFDFGVASAVLAVSLGILGLGVNVHALWLPPLLALLVLFTAGLAMLLACAGLFFRDVKYLVEILVTFGIFFTPVFFEARMFGAWAPLLLLNPVGAILEAVNSVVVLGQAPEPFWLGYAAVWAVGGFLVAWKIFDRAEPAFAENI